GGGGLRRRGRLSHGAARRAALGAHLVRGAARVFAAVRRVPRRRRRVARVASMMCPSCAAVVPPAVWKLVGALVTMPFFIFAAVFVAVRRAHRALPPAPPASRPPPDGAPFA